MENENKKMHVYLLELKNEPVDNYVLVSSKEDNETLVNKFKKYQNTDHNFIFRLLRDDEIMRFKTQDYHIENWKAHTLIIPITGIVNFREVGVGCLNKDNELVKLAC